METLINKYFPIKNNGDKIIFILNVVNCCYNRKIYFGVEWSQSHNVKNTIALSEDDFNEFYEDKAIEHYDFMLETEIDDFN